MGVVLSSAAKAAVCISGLIFILNVMVLWESHAQDVTETSFEAVEALNLFQPDDPFFGHGEIYSSETILQEFKLFSGKPFDDPRLAFRFLIPKGWVAEPVMRQQSPALTPFTPTRLTVFRGPLSAAGTPFLELDAFQLDYDITALDWLRTILLPRGYEPERMKAFSDHRAEAETSFIYGSNQTFRGRAIAIIHGNIVHFLHYAAPAVLFKERRDRYGVIAASLDMPSPSQDVIEPRFSLNIGDGFFYHYPATWQLGESGKLENGFSRAELFNFNALGEVDGLIHLEAQTKADNGENPQKLEQVHLRLDEYGVEIGERLSEEDHSLTGKASYSPAENQTLNVYEAATNNMSGPHEVWILTRDDQKHFRSLTLVTPDRHESPASWARNRRALEIMAMSWLKPAEK